MIYPDLPVKAISIRQPWAALIIYGGKDIENRSRRTNFRGSVALHASMTIEGDIVFDLENALHPCTGRLFRSDAVERRRHLVTGGIVGVADVIDCVDHYPSEWFFGPYGYVLANARPVDFIPCPGALGLFDWRKMLEKAESKRMTA